MTKKQDNISKHGYAKPTKGNSMVETKNDFWISKYFGFQVAKIAHFPLLDAILKLFKNCVMIIN